MNHPRPALRARRLPIAQQFNSVAQGPAGPGGTRQTMDETPAPGGSFARIPERNTSDVLLRTAQQHHVSLSSMADLKANILITISTIVLTWSLGRMGEPEVRATILTLAGFTLVALFLAILAVLPKYRGMRVDQGPLPQDFNLLFFGHFAGLSRERFLEEVTRSMKPDGSVYLTMANDLYSIGWYLAHRKYRYLRYSYLFFLAGLVCACIVRAWTMLAP